MIMIFSRWPCSLATYLSVSSTESTEVGTPRAAAGRSIFCTGSVATWSLVTIRRLAPTEPTQVTVTWPWMRRLSMRMWRTGTRFLSYPDCGRHYPALAGRDRESLAEVDDVVFTGLQRLIGQGSGRCRLAHHQQFEQHRQVDPADNGRAGGREIGAGLSG